MEFHDPLANSPRFSSGALRNLLFRDQMLSILVVPQRGSFFLTGSILFFSSGAMEKLSLNYCFRVIGTDLSGRSVSQGRTAQAKCVIGTDRQRRWRQQPRSENTDGPSQPAKNVKGTQFIDLPIRSFYRFVPFSLQMMEFDYLSDHIHIQRTVHISCHD